jgi:hypothetical protein
MSTKNNPGDYDCYKNAEPDEEMFILLARDKTSPGLVRRWAMARKEQINCGLKPVDDMLMVEEALKCADKMEKWRSENRD